MTSSEQVREEIARVLHRQATDDGEVHVLWGGANEHEEEVAEWLPFSDALLTRWPVLAGVTDSMVEAGAKALYEFWHEQLEPFGLPWQRVPEDRRDPYLAEARAVLEAVYGKAEA